MADKTAAKQRSNGMGTIFKDKNRFYLRISADNGKRKSFLLRNEDGSYCTTKPDAEKAAARLTKVTANLDTEQKIVETLAEIRDLKHQSTVTINQLWEMYEKTPRAREITQKSIKEQRRIWSRFSDWLNEHGATMASDISSILANEYMAEYGETVSNKTFNEVRTLLSHILQVAVKSSILLDNPFKDIEKRVLETISRQEFTEEQVQRIFDGFKTGFFYEMNTKKAKDGTQRKIRMEYKPLYADEMEVLLKLCCFTGCDGESGCLMKWENVNLDTCIISYIREKTRRKTGGRVITLPMHETLREALLRAREWAKPDSPYILPNVAARYKYNHCGVQKDVMKIIRLALGVEVTNHGETGKKRALAANVYSLHSFRHTFVSFCANAGVPMAVVASIVGHGNPAMTNHYSHISTEAKGRAISMLPTFNLPSAPATAMLEPAQPTTRAQLHDIIDKLDDATVTRLFKIATEYMAK